MSVHIVKLPDVGEGIAEAELVAWHVSVGDAVTADSVLAEVLTDKATVEISSPVAGTVTFVTGNPGEVLAVGSDLVGIELGGPGPVTVGASAEDAGPVVAPTAIAEPVAAVAAPTTAVPTPTAPYARNVGERPIAAPVVRQRAKDSGIDLRLVSGSGPAGRITEADLDAYLRAEHGATARGRHAPDASTTVVPVVGLRRKIADKVSLSATRIPHITYVEELDVTSLEELRGALNAEAATEAPKLTVLPFVMRAIVQAVAEQPQFNSLFDDEAGMLTTYAGVHIGIATQTPNGLIVPVVRHAETLDLWEAAAEVARVSEAARSGGVKRDELSGSTITITSLGALGGLVTTPIINHPEVAVVGVNKMQVRPVWNGVTFLPRTMMNLSSSFDHRIIDGWEAATFIQRVKALIEQPALLFIDRPPS